MYSLDLSSATDRLPVQIQSQIIDFIWPGVGESWRKALVERQYFNPDSKTGLTYSVGQPMGAYSSWAMLALTHHFIIQVAAWMACVTPSGVLFTKYAVLGDDVVIGNKAVMNKYLFILSQLGVECGLHKSLLSPNGTALEFAKRTWHLGKDVSPITIKELVAALTGPSNLVSFMNHHQVPLSSALSIGGFGYKVVGGLNKPFYKLGRLVRDTILTTILPGSMDSIEVLFGRSSLTSYSWNPEIGHPGVIGVLRRLILQVSMSLQRHFNSPNPLVFEDFTVFNTLMKTGPQYSDLVKDIQHLWDSLRSSMWVQTIDPLELLRLYLSHLRSAALIKGSVTTEQAKAKFGVEPMNVKLWKLWSKSLHSMTKVSKGNAEKVEVKFLRSSFLPSLPTSEKKP
jgi:hypothetical protein